MKKFLTVFMLVTFFVSSFAFPFRTSCNKILEVNGEYFNQLSDAQAAQYLSDLNYAACNEYPKKIVVYYSH